MRRMNGRSVTSCIGASTSAGRSVGKRERTEREKRPSAALELNGVFPLELAEALLQLAGVKSRQLWAGADRQPHQFLQHLEPPDPKAVHLTLLAAFLTAFEQTFFSSLSDEVIGGGHG